MCVVVPKRLRLGTLVVAGCYWNHRPRPKFRVANRGFHIAYVAPDPGRKARRGTVVQIPDGGAWTVEETGVHRDEQGWRQ